MGVGGLFVFGGRGWPRCREEGGLKRLSVGGFSGLILCHRGIKRRDMTLVRSLDIRAGLLIPVIQSADQ